MVGGSLKEREALRGLLRQARGDAGMRQVELALRLKRPQSYVSKYESGEKSLDFLEVKEVCAALGLTLCEFSRRFEEILKHDAGEP